MGLLCRWPSITEWEVHITDHVFVLSPISEMTYTVSSGTLNSTIPYLAVKSIAVKAVQYRHDVMQSSVHRVWS